jgi:NADP-reducing hydrogenase subunit HndD
MSKITLKIDHKKIEVPEGSTVLDAARAANVYIPTLCDDPLLEPFGACRLCIVEIDGYRGLPTACSTPAAEGMEVHTSSPMIETNRKTSMNLLLSDHPLDCQHCVSNMRCDLQYVAAYVGVRGENPYKGERRAYDLDESNPFYSRDLEMCILCGKCVRACDELQGRQAISFGYRGFSTKITTPFDLPMWDSTCESCGRCVDMCPTGALYDKTAKKHGLPTGETKTTCPYCGVGCGLILETRDGEIIGARGDRENSVNEGHTCVKGRYGWEYVQHADRVKKPLVRKYLLEGKKKSEIDRSSSNWEWAETSWDTALEITASNLTQIRDRHGADSIGFMTSAKCLNEENYLVNKLARQVIGTNNIDHCARL